MHEAATLNGYETTLAAVRSARTVLGIAKSRKHYERKSARRTTPSPVADFTPPSDQAILEHLILKMGVDQALCVFARVARRGGVDISVSEMKPSGTRAIGRGRGRQRAVASSLSGG